MTYSQLFFDYIEIGSRRSAGELIPHMQRLLPEARSVLDVGCGRGAWLAVWAEQGFAVTGVDGEYARTDKLLIDDQAFVAHDLTVPFDLGKRFDLVQSLEVAEHLPPSCAASFVATLVRHGDIVLFSAAVPGQGGLHHINERPYEDWRDLFAAHGYVLCDALRPLLQGNVAVEPWYRYNTLLFVKEDLLPTLSVVIQNSRLPATGRVPRYEPPLHTVRLAVMKLFPRWLVDGLARYKHRVAVARLSLTKRGTVRPTV